MINIINAISFKANPHFHPDEQREKLPWYLAKNAQGDVFTKSEEASAPKPIDPEELKKQYPNDFIEWAKNTDFIKNGLKDSLKQENCIGQGFEHAAYKINGNPHYVLRIRRGFYTTTQNYDYSNYTMSDTRDMELIGNFGQEVALLKPDQSDPEWGNKPHIEVLKMQNGFPHGNCSPRALYHEDGSLRAGFIPYEDPSRKEHYQMCMETIANFPDESYDKLIDDLLVSGEAGYKFDHLNSNNFLIDPEEQRINIIDMQRTKKPHKDRFGNTLWALVNLEFLSEYIRRDPDCGARSEDEINHTIDNLLTIMDKYTAAMKRKIQKYNKNSYEFHLLMRDMLSSFWLKSMDIDQKFQKLRDMDVLYEGDEI